MRNMLLDDYLQEIGPAIRELSFDCSVVAGGSYSYRHSLYKSLQEFRDIDLLIFLPTAEAIVDFMTVHQKDLDRILQLNEVEKHFDREELSFLTLGYADGIRYSGVNDLGQKISAKILAYDRLQIGNDSSGQTRINIISKKDKRFYPHKTLSGELVDFGVINQKFGLDNCILGDPDIFRAGDDYCLGVVTDVLLTGMVLCNSSIADVYELKKKIIDKIVNVCRRNGFPQKWSDIIIRSERLSDEFADTFCKQFPPIPQNEENQKQNKGGKYFMYLVSPLIGGLYDQTELKIKNNSGVKEKRYLRTSGPFSSNSNYGLMIYNNGERAFFKEMLNEYRYRGEMYGLITASRFYKNLRAPIYTDPNNLLVSYDWFPGDMLARYRRDDVMGEKMNKIMELELQKTEDHLNAYVRSTTNTGIVDGVEVYESRIHDLYYGRLMGDRYDEYFKKVDLETPQGRIPFSKIESLPIKINGRVFPSLVQIKEKSKRILEPSAFARKERICGLGDAHAGNVLCSSNFDSYLYVDYEFSGFHSPYLDIAKQLYIDSAFDIFYADILPTRKDAITMEINNGYCEIRHNYEPNKLSSYLYKTKMGGILIPYRNYSLTHNIHTDDDWKQILGAAMFCCGMLSRNIAKFGQREFMLNLANSIEATDIDYYSSKFNK